MGVTPPNVRKARKWAQSVPSAWLECRSENRHDLEPYSAFGKSENIGLEYQRQRGVYEMYRVCRRCGTKVWSVVEKGTGYVGESRRYQHPEGYLFDGGDGARMGREATGQVRLELIRQALDEAGALSLVRGA